MTPKKQQNTYYSATISDELETYLIQRKVDTERFKRDLFLMEKGYIKAEINKKDTPFELNADVIEYLIKQQQAMFNTQAPERFLADDRTREANEELLHIRQKTLHTRQKARGYTGTFDDKSKSEQQKILAQLKDVWSQSTLGMSPLDYALKTTDDMMNRLELHASNRPYAQTLLKTISSGFSKEEEKIKSKQIDLIEYVKNCQKILDAHAHELKKPQTLFEAAQHFFLNGLRAIFNIFDRLYTWVMSYKKTLAEHSDRIAYIPEPKTRLAKEIEAIQSERPKFENELHRDMQAINAIEEKNAKRLERVAAAKTGQHPEKNAFEERKTKAPLKKQDEKLSQHSLFSKSQDIQHVPLNSSSVTKIQHA
jgi:hypothetical protein